jgi:hypothetical protein
MDNITDFKPVNDRKCKISVKLKFYNLTNGINSCTTWRKRGFGQEQFYMYLENV